MPIFHTLILNNFCHMLTVVDIIIIAKLRWLHCIEVFKNVCLGSTYSIS